MSLQSNAQVAIGQIDGILTSVLSMRAQVGAIMNRLEATVTNLGTMVSNYSSASSQITDTNFATETTNFTRDQILTQSATSMLAQANQLPNNVLSLLK